MSRQSSASVSTPPPPGPSGSLKEEIDEKKPLVDAKPTTRVTRKPLAGPEFSDNVTFATPKSKSPNAVAKSTTKLAPKRKGRPKVRPSLLSVLLRLSFLTLAAYTFLCPITSPTPNQPITGPCTLLARAHTDIYSPFISPHLQSAWSSVLSHPQGGPYAQHLENTFNYVAPYVSSTRSVARSRLIPVFDKAQELILQTFTEAHIAAKPHIDPYLTHVSDVVNPYWTHAIAFQRQHVGPRILALRAQTQYAIRTATPYALRARIALLQAYQKVKPHVYTAWLYIKFFAMKASVAIADVFDAHIKPQWDMIMKEVGHIQAGAGEKASPVIQQAHATFSVAAESAASMAAAAHTEAASVVSVAHSQAAGYAAAARESVLAAAFAVHSVASEYVSIVQDKLSSITSAAHATANAAAATASQEAADVITDEFVAVSASATQYASKASAVSSTFSIAASAVVDAASAVSDTQPQAASHVNEAAATSSPSAPENGASVAEVMSSSLSEHSFTPSSAMSHATAAAAPADDAELEAPAQIMFKAASMVSSAADVMPVASATSDDAGLVPTLLNEAYQSQAAFVASLAESSAAAAASVAGKLEQPFALHQDAQAAAELLGQTTPSEPSTEADDQAGGDEFECWFTSLLTDQTPDEVGTETVSTTPPIEAESPITVPDTSLPKYHPPTAEELAQKRKGIEDTHTKWEEMLHAIGQGAIERLQREIERARESSSDKLLGENGGDWGRDVATYEKDAGRVAERVEQYAHELHAEDRPAHEKTEMLLNVITKVRAQVERWASDIETKLKDWWVGSEAGIAADVDKARQDVMDIAHQAQNELGMQYAWLEDVTVQDWTRYHALVNEAKRYGKTYSDLMSLTEDSALYKALANLTAHIQDVLLGFEARLALIHPFADAPVSGADDADSLVSPDIAEEEAQAPLFIPGVTAQADALPYLQRSQEEVEHALKAANAASEFTSSITSTTSEHAVTTGSQVSNPVEAERGFSLVLDSVPSEIGQTFTQSTDSIKSPAEAETAPPVLDRASLSLTSVASSISDHLNRQEL
ncbi:hypothetical protein DACRYDRAFT_102836 [Dacryopinax primogenitus]|uniref:Uncharacterized protein n=1 Tax=Dacryopinax primogenitus (strain DJM 731) TaxID=1858805 RepID=M5FTJ9_DACPD|nr:uncharacterized protein DACRYDRAFT_102836 [Dacryopinax primogenitus]EJT96571.1 hypothetical protein DACRYDRAFT_102836 [Dacryopinax primogenitus]